MPGRATAVGWFYRVLRNAIRAAVRAMLPGVAVVRASLPPTHD